MSDRGETARVLQSTPVLMSGDYVRSKAFYEQTLKFRVVEEGGDPPRFGIFERGGAAIFVNAWSGARAPVPDIWDAYLHVSGLERLFEELESAGAPITRSIEDTVYGMREFEVTDPDGNVLCFGEDSEKAAS